MDPYAMQNRMSPRGGVKVNPLGALLCLALGLCLTVLSMGYAVGVHVTDLNRFRQAADAALVQTGIVSAGDAERFAQETIGYLTGRRAAWLSAITVGGQAFPVSEAFTVHMAQVQRWTTAFRYLVPLMIAAVAVLVFLTLIGAAAMRTRLVSPRAYLLGAAIPVLVAGVGFLWALIDFQSFWEQLHNWLIPGGVFSADESVMKLFPLSLFQGYLWPIALTFLYCMAGVVLLPAVLILLDKWVRRRRMTRQTPYFPTEYR